MAAPTMVPSAEGVASKPSSYTVPDTMRRLEETAGVDAAADETNADTYGLTWKVGARFKFQ